MKRKKQKKIARFMIKRRGYDIEAVENYISAEQARYDEVQLSQRERIAALTEECNRLSGELAEDRKSVV